MDGQDLPEERAWMIGFLSQPIPVQLFCPKSPLQDLVPARIGIPARRRLSRYPNPSMSRWGPLAQYLPYLGWVVGTPLPGVPDFNRSVSIRREAVCRRRRPFLLGN